MKKYKKVIFLDIDGVLNYIGSKIVHRLYVMDDDCVARLKKIVDEYNTVIVITSRKRIPVRWKQKILDLFADSNWYDPPIIDRTCPLVSHDVTGRGKKIQKWLRDNPTESYIIIDDCPVVLKEQLPFLIHTSMSSGGLTEKHVKQIRNIWKK